MMDDDDDNDDDDGDDDEQSTFTRSEFVCLWISKASQSQAKHSKGQLTTHAHPQQT